MSESAYKPTDAFEDELDQLALSIRDELRAAGFRPAFDPEPEQLARARKLEQMRRRRRTVARSMIGYVAPVLVIVVISIAFRLLFPGV